MQLTLIGREGLLSNGHVTHEEIKNALEIALSLGNAVIGKNLTPPQSDWQLDRMGVLCPTQNLPKEYQTPVLAPDLILTSSFLKAKETAFTILEQLKQAGIKPKVQYNVACLNILKKSSDHASNLHTKEQIKRTIELIQKHSEEGKQHIIIVSQKANAQRLLKLLKNDKSAIEQPFDTGIAYTFTDVNPANIGKETYFCQRRFFEKSLNDKIPVFSVDYIEWHMPDFMYIDSKKAILNNTLEKNNSRE